MATSPVECGGFDAADQMHRYAMWHERGDLSRSGRFRALADRVAGARGA